MDAITLIKSQSGLVVCSEPDRMRKFLFFVSSALLEKLVVIIEIDVNTFCLGGTNYCSAIQH